MATKLNALLGILATFKTNTKKTQIDALKLLGKSALFSGFTKTYQVDDEETGEQLPPETQLVQHRADTLLADLIPDWARLMDLQATVDTTNQQAVATLQVVGPPREGGDSNVVMAVDLPVTTLLWLEKQLADLAQLVAAAPEVDPTKLWDTDPASGLFVTQPRKSIKTKKTAYNHVLAPEGKFPAQVQILQTDQRVGEWTTIDQTGAMFPTRKRELLVRVADVQERVKLAREEANQTDVTDVRFGDALLRYLLKVN